MRWKAGAGLPLICYLFFSIGAFAEGLTKEQGDAILNELRQIKTLLERLKAAQAARCAGDQWNHWEMHDHLSANPNSLGSEA
jgi:hypothetical protein